MPLASPVQCVARSASASLRSWPKVSWLGLTTIDRGRLQVSVQEAYLRFAEEVRRSMDCQDAHVRDRPGTGRQPYAWNTREAYSEPGPHQSHIVSKYGPTGGFAPIAR